MNVNHIDFFLLIICPQLHHSKFITPPRKTDYYCSVCFVGGKTVRTLSSSNKTGWSYSFINGPITFYFLEPNHADNEETISQTPEKIRVICYFFSGSGC